MAGKRSVWEYRGLRLLIPAAIVAVTIQAVNVFLNVSDRLSKVLQFMFFIVLAIGIIGLVIHYRDMYQVYRERSKG